MTELWIPDASTNHLAQSGYIHYAAGIAIVNNPNRVFELHQVSSQDSQQRDQLLVHAQTMMWHGLEDVIRYTNPPYIGSSLKRSEQHYKDALPFMIAAVDDLAKEEPSRLERLNKLLPVMKPLPLARETIYRSVAHARKQNVTLNAVMGGFTIDSSFGSDAAELTFERVVKRARKDSTAARDQAAKDERLLSKISAAAFSEGPLPGDK